MTSFFFGFDEVQEAAGNIFVGHSRSLTTDAAGPGHWGVDAANLDGLVVIAVLMAFYMAWGIGANDAANNFGTSWGSGALSMKACLAISAVCEFCGAVFLGGDVQKTFRKGIANVKLYTGPDGRVLMMVGMTCVLFSAATWLLFSSSHGLPVSTTHSAVGGVIAFAIASKGYGSVVWWPEDGKFGGVGGIVLSWITSPLLSMLVAFGTYTAIKKNILESEKSFERAILAIPVFAFATVFTITLFVVYKGGKGIGLHKTEFDTAVLAAVCTGATFGLCMYALSGKIAKTLDYETEEAPSKVSNKAAKMEKNTLEHIEFQEQEPNDALAIDIKVGDAIDSVAEKPRNDILSSSDESDKDSTAPFVPPTMAMMTKTERLFCGFLWMTASFQAIAHGGNDVANSVGLLAAVLAAEKGELQKKSDVPMWVFVMAGLGICLGLAMYGRNVMVTLGSKVTKITPSKAFAAELAATFVILLATKLGIPISTTHASIGAVMGVGMADMGRQGVDWKVMRNVFFSWVLTLPVVGAGMVGIYGFVLPMVIDKPIYEANCVAP